MAMIDLVAIEGRSLPREDVRYRMVDGTDEAPTTVPESPYYRRALARGDVRLAAAAKTSKPKKEG